MDLLTKLKKNSRIKGTSILSESTFFDQEPTILDVPIMNIGFSGKLDGGMESGLHIFAGPSKHGKSILAALCARAYMNKYDDAILLFFDSEFGTPESYFESLDIPSDRILHIPLLNVEELKFDIVNQLEMIKTEFPGAKVFILVDSFGNTASKKEAEDALDGKSKQDMTRAKEFKSLTRIVTPYLKIMEIPMIAIAHTYDTLEIYSRKVVSGGCFVAGTGIKMADGTIKNIEDITVGDYVATYEGYKEVTHTWNKETLDIPDPECYEVEFEDGSKYVCSDKHPFRVYGEWIEARHLNNYMYCDRHNNSCIKIKSVKKVEKQDVYDISVKDNQSYVLDNGAIVHNTGPYYSATNVFIMGRRQEKDGKDVTGFNLIMNVDKSRNCVEKVAFPIELRFGGGLNKYTGLLDVALKTGDVIKPSMGWYSRVIDSVPEDKKWRAKDTNTAEFWDILLESDTFKTNVKNLYHISSTKLIQDGDDDVVNVPDLDSMEFTSDE